MEIESEHESALLSVDEERMSKYKELLDSKLKFYRKNCNRYNLNIVKIIENCIVDERELCNLDEYMIGTSQCKLMFEAFQKYPISQLTTISLKNNHLKSQCFEAMTSFITMSNKLRNLNLAGCKIGSEGVKVLVQAFSNSSSIISLNLSNNEITDDGGEILVSFLSSNDFCEELDLSCNCLGFASSVELGKALLENQTLIKLDLRHNRLYENFGIVQLMQGLSMCKSLAYLDVSFNAICGEPVGAILSKSIKKMNLKVLKIENNGLQSYELKKLALGLKYSKTIREVYAGGNSFTSEEEEAMVKVFASNSPLQLLSFGSFYHLSHEAYELLKEVQELKPSIRVIYQNIIHPKPPREVSMLDICADRAKLLALKPKQRRLQRDMGEFMLKLKNHSSNFMLKSEFLSALRDFKANLDNDLINSYIEASLVVDEGRKKHDVHLMANHYLNRHMKN